MERLKQARYILMSDKECDLPFYPVVQVYNCGLCKNLEVVQQVAQSTNNNLRTNGAQFAYLTKTKTRILGGTVCPHERI